MKKLLIFCTSVLMLLYVAELRSQHEDESLDESGLLWKGEVVDCTVKIKFTLGGGPIPGSVSYEESYEGKKDVCRDGWELCWSSSCS